MVCGAGDATLGVMGTSATSSMVGRLVDLSLLSVLFAALGAISVGVVTVHPGALRGTGACMTGGGVGNRTGVALSSGALPGWLRMESRIEPISLGLTITGMIGGGDGTSGCSAICGATTVDTSCAESCKFSTTSSKLLVALLSCVAAVCPTDSPVITETVESSEISLAMSTIVGGPGAFTCCG